MKNNPKYVRFPKTHTLLDQFYINLIPYSRHARTVLDFEKRPFLREFFDESDTPLDFQVAPRAQDVAPIKWIHYTKCTPQCIHI